MTTVRQRALSAHLTTKKRKKLTREGWEAQGAPGACGNSQAGGAGEHNCFPEFPSTWMEAGAPLGPWPTCRISQRLSSYILWRLLSPNKQAGSTGRHCTLLASPCSPAPPRRQGPMCRKGVLSSNPLPITTQHAGPLSLQPARGRLCRRQGGLGAPRGS